jgi:DNA-binding response OmpR family regulator
VTSTSADRLPTWASRRPRFLLVVAEPDRDAAAALAAELKRHHVDTELCESVADALLAAGILRPDAVLLAAGQRGMSGADTVRALSRRAGIPVVVGVADGDGGNVAAVLAAGANACIARPYRVNELIPIMRAIRPETIGTLEPPLEIGSLFLDPATLEVRLDGKRIALPLREYQVLRFLMTNADRVVTREQIHENIWGDSHPEGSNTLTVHIKRLRMRLGDHAKNPQVIVSVRGVGYRLIPPLGPGRNA